MTRALDDRLLARRFEDQCVLVTGAGGGLGAEMARRFFAEGASLVLWDADGDRLANIERELGSSGGEEMVFAKVVDVRDSAAVATAATEALNRCGRVDVVVNNAGRFVDGRIEELSDKAWDEVIDINLTGAFRVVRAFLPAMKINRYGRIISLSSLSRRGNFGQANYSAAKAGIVGMARTIALEGASFGITSNVIAPGPIDTPMLAALKATVREKMARSVPMKRIGTPADIAAAAAFLASKEASFITGVALDVDGGLRLPFVHG